MHSKNIRELSKKFQAAITDHVENSTSVEVAREILVVLADAYEEDNLPRAAFIASHLAKAIGTLFASNAGKTV